MRNITGFQVKSNFELKDADEKTGIVTGYASIFGNEDSDREIVMPGAFAKTIQERGPGSVKPRIKHLWQHDSWAPIGIPVKLQEDSKGLYFETQFGKDSFSQDKLQQHIDGIITELSIGYKINRSQEQFDEGNNFLNRILIELKLWEYSSVTWGSNSLTEIISAKGEVKDIMADLTKRLEALNRGLKNGKYTDETCEQFEAEICKIASIIQSLELKKPDVISTPETEPTKYMESILLTLKNFQ